MPTITITELGARAIGAFGPKEGQKLPADFITLLSSNDFIETTKQQVIGGCSDERLNKDNSRLELPPVFGGWYSAVIADALSTRLWLRSNMAAREHAIEMTNAFETIHPDILLCEHTDISSEHKPECGCAAIAKAPAVLAVLRDNPNLIARPYRQILLNNINDLLARHYFQGGTTSLVDALQDLGLQKEVLVGEHSAVAVVINNQVDTVYNRPEFYRHYTSLALTAPTFFEYSRWAMRRTASMLMPTKQLMELFFAAGDAFNKAVPLAICNRHTLLVSRT